MTPPTAMIPFQGQTLGKSGKTLLSPASNICMLLAMQIEHLKQWLPALNLEQKRPVNAILTSRTSCEVKMRSILFTSVIVVIVAVLVIFFEIRLSPARAQTTQQTVTKRIWSRDIGRGQQVVVDVSFVEDEPFSYDWRKLINGKPDESACFGVYTSAFWSGAIPKMFPVEVLDGNATPVGDLLAVYNQRGKAWAAVSHVLGSGLVELMPDKQDFRPDNRDPAANNLGPALKYASITSNEDGVVRVEGVSADDKKVTFELRAWNYFRETHYYWKQIN